MTLTFPRLAVPQERLLPKGTWAQPKLTGKGDAEDIIHAAVGRSLSAWAGVEETLADVTTELCKDYATMVVPSHASILFGAIESVANKLLAIKRLASKHFHPYWGVAAIRKPFDILEREVKVAAMRRNDIAHGKVVPVKISNSRYLSRRHPDRTDESAGYMLVAPEHVTGRNKSEPARGASWSDSDYRMSARDIIIFGAAFHDLEAATYEYILFVQKDTESGLPLLTLQLMADDPRAFGHGRRQ